MCDSYLTRLKNVLILLFVIMVIFVAQQFVLAQDNISRGSLFRIGNNINIKEGEVVNTVFSIGGKVVVNGEVKGNIIAIGKLITVSGEVEKDIVSVGNNIVLKEGSVVGGDVISIGGKILRWEGSEVRGKVKEIAKFPFAQNFYHKFSNLPFNYQPFFYRGYPPSFEVYLGGGFSLFKLIILLLIAGLVTFLFSQQINNIAFFASREPGESLLFGILGAILIIPLTVALGLSVIGIPLVFFLILLIIIANIIGVVGIDLLIGRRFLNTFNFKNPANLWCVFIGLIILEMVKTIPYLGGMIMLAVYLFGFGAVIKTRFGSNGNI